MLTAKSIQILTVLLIMGILCGNSPGHPPAANPASATTNAPAKSGARAEDLLWSSAQECLKNAQYKEACDKFVQFARQYHNDPQYREALFYQGLCEMKMGKETQAERTWEQVLSLELPEKVKSKALLLTLEQLAGYYGRKNKENDEKKTLNQLLVEYPSNAVTVSAYVQAAETRLKKSDYAGALVFYRAVEKKLSENDRKNIELAEAMTAKKDAGNPRELLKAADESFEKDNVEQAITLYQTVLKQNPDTPLTAEIKTKLGWSLYVQGKWQKSEMLWQDVVRKGPPNDKWAGQCRWHMIQLLMGPAGKPDKASELCEEQAKAFPNDPQGERALFIRAWLYWTQKKWVQARAAFDDLFAAYPANAIDPPVRVYVRDCDEGIRKARGGGK